MPGRVEPHEAPALPAMHRHTSWPTHLVRTNGPERFYDVDEALGPEHQPRPVGFTAALAVETETLPTTRENGWVTHPGIAAATDEPEPLLWEGDQA